MRKIVIALILILSMFLIVSCDMDDHKSHEIVTVRIAKEAGTNHSYCFEYFSHEYGGEVKSFPSPYAVGTTEDWFKLPMNEVIKYKIDGEPKGSFIITESYQLIVP